MNRFEFDALIMKHGDIDAAYIEFPYDVEKEYGTKGQVKVRATFDDMAYRGSLAKMGHSCHMLGLTKEIRMQIGKKPGDTVHVIIEKDLEERTVTIPEELKTFFLKDPEPKAFFEKLAFTHKKEYVVWIDSAKKPETRQARVEKTIEMLKHKIKSKS